MKFSLATLLLLATLCAAVEGADEQVLCDFETPQSLKAVDARKAELVPEHASQGKSAAKVGAGFTLVCGGWNGLPADWSGFDQLKLDIFNPGENCRMSVWIADDGGTDYWDRHNNSYPLRAGENTLSVPVGGMYRGEKGSGKFLNTKNIKQLVIVLPKEAKAGFFIDNLRLSKGGAVPSSTEIKLLAGFEEGEKSGAKWAIEDYPLDKPGKSIATPVAEHATQGAKALKLEYREHGGNITLSDFADRDWSKFDVLEIDCFSTAAAPARISGWFRDEASKEAGYWERHNYKLSLKPGASTIRFPIGGLYRGEKGSGRFLDSKAIHSFCIASEGLTVYLDHFRLVKGSTEAVVEGLRKFDFGPPTSANFPGFTAVNKATAYSKERGFGWLDKLPEDERNYEHPDSLYCDFVRLSGGETFAIDVPNGEYFVFAMLDIIGYWDTNYYHSRIIDAEGREVLKETVTPEEFLKNRYFKHQDTEDLPGTDIWQKYMQAHFQPKTFKVKVEDGQLNLTFKGDTWGLTLSALAVFPAKQEEAGQRWLGDLDNRRREEYYNSLTEQIRKPDPKPSLSAEEEKAGFVLFRRDLEKEVAYNAAPGGDPSDTKQLGIDLAAAPGEYESADFCVYPLKDCGELSVKASDLSGPGVIPAAAIRTRVIRYKFLRIGGRITTAYEYRPWTMVDFQSFPISAGVTRRFWVTLKVPGGAAPGKYSGKLAVTIAGRTVDIPIALEVFPLKLDDPKMSIGMYGGAGPTSGHWPAEVQKAYRLEERIEEVFRDQKEHGMTAVTPPAPRLIEIKDGKAQFDFSRTDAAMATLRKLGFKHECFTYATMFQVREGDLEAEARKRYGVSLETGIAAAYQALGAHAKENNWLPMAWCLADEPLIHGVPAETVTKVFNAHRKAAPQMKFMSEDAMGDPSHYGVIPAIDIVSGNTPRYKVAEAVKKAGGRYWFNNIGTTRLTFGWFLYKASREMGVEALFQWGYSVNKADIYYDLDGSEGDRGCAFTASEGQRAVRHWETIREGADDHRYIQTLDNLIQKAQGDAAKKPKADEAGRFIDETMKKINLESRGEMAYSQQELEALKRKLAGYILELSK